MIPTISKRLSGNKAIAAHFLGLAQRQLNILLRDMSLSIPKPLTIGERTLDLGHGAYITVSACYNERVMQIHVPFDPEKQGGLKVIEPLEECFCNCSFALGYIISESENTPAWPDENRRYDVAVCNKKEKYKLFRYCLPSDHLNWEAEFINYGMESIEGMPVIVFLDNARTDAHLCCIYETSGFVENIEQTACSPTIPEVPSETPETDAPVYRIVPIFPTGIGKWAKVKMIIDVEEKKQHGLLQT